MWKGVMSGNLFATSFPGRLGRNSFLVMKYGMLGCWGNGKKVKVSNQKNGENF
jgi:hypothetical protein